MKKSWKVKVATFSLAVTGIAFSFCLLSEAKSLETTGGGYNSEITQGEVHEGTSPTSKRAATGIVAPDFDTSNPYRFNGTSQTPQKYLESLSFTQISRSRTSQSIRIDNARYTTTASNTDHVSIGSYKTCSSSSTGYEYDNRQTVYTQDLENNDQPYITSPNDITVAGYNGDTFVQNLSFTLDKGISHSTKYYLQNLQINVNLINTIDSYKVSFSNVHFTTSYNYTDYTDTTSKHITTAHVDAWEELVASNVTSYDGSYTRKALNTHHDEVGHYETVTDQPSYYSYGDWTGWYNFNITCNQPSGNSGSYFQYYGTQYISGLPSDGDVQVQNVSMGSLYSEYDYGMSGSDFKYIVKVKGGGAGGTTVTGQVRGRTKTWHPAVTRQVWKVDTAAYDTYDYWLTHPEVTEESHTDHEYTGASFSANSRTQSAEAFTVNLNQNNPVSYNSYNTNVADVYEWFETKVDKNNTRSFNNQEDAFNVVRNIISNSKVQETISYDNLEPGVKWWSNQNNYSFSNPLGADCTNYNRIYFNSQPASTTGNMYDVYVLPDYSGANGSIKNSNNKGLIAFRLDEEDEMNDFINEQANKFIQYKTIFGDGTGRVTPSDNYPGQSVVNESINYVSSITFDNTLHNVNYVGKEFLDNSFTTKTNTTATNTMYTYQNDYGHNLDDYTNAYKVGNLSSDEWKNIAKAQGNSVFVNWFNQLLDGTSSSFHYVITNDELTNSTNTITFSSNDKMFVRIVKDGDEDHATILESNTIYNLPTNDYASVASKQSPIYTFNEAGTYQIQMVNTSGNTSNNTKTITLNIYDEDSLYANVTATNYRLNLDIINPASSKAVPISNLEIYEISGSTGYEDERIHLVSIDDTPTKDSSYHQITVDDINTTVGASNTHYVFKQDDASVDNQFNKKYYIEVTLANYTKKYYLYWNYLQPDANNLTISLTDVNWEKNVGYSVNYIPVFTWADSEHTDTPTDISQDYTYVVVGTGNNPNPNAVVVDKETQTIRAVEEGTCRVIFSIAVPPEQATEWDNLDYGDEDSDGLVFTITDTDELRKEIIINSHPGAADENIELQLGESQEVTASVNPEWKNQELTFTTSNADVATYENGMVVSHNPGSATITVHSEDLEIADKVINVTVSELDKIFNNTSSFAFVNNNIAVEFVAHNSDEVSIVSSNESIGRYNSETGEYEFISEGVVTFTASYYGVETEVTYIVLQENLKAGVSLDLGETFDITYPNNTDFSVEIVDEDVLNVENNSLEAVAEGNTKIKFTPLELIDIEYIEIPVTVSSAEHNVNNVSSFVYEGTSEDILYTMPNVTAYIITSSDEEVVIVENGKFNFNKPGEATITVNYYDHEQTLTFVVLDSYLGEDVQIALGESKNFNYIEGVNFVSGNNKVEVAEGTFKGIKTGEATVTVSKTGLFDKTFNVLVVAPGEIIKNENQIAFVGDSIILTSDAYDIEAISFVSSKEGAISVDNENFAIVCNEEGTIEITANYYDQQSVLTLYIVQTNLKNELTLALGQKLDITYVESNLVFSTSNEKLNYSNKVVTAVDSGTSMIKIAVKNSDIKYSVPVTIVAPESIVDNNSKIVYVGTTIDVTYLIADETQVKINISDKNVIEYDANTKKITAKAEGKATLSFEYYNSKTILNFMVIKSDGASFVDNTDSKKPVVDIQEVEDTSNIDSATATEVNKELCIDIPNGYAYTITKDGVEYTPTKAEQEAIRRGLVGGEITTSSTLNLTEDGEYVLTIYRTYTEEEKATYGEANLQEDMHVYKFKINKGTNTPTERETKISYGMEALIAPIIIGTAVVLAVVITLIATKKRKVSSMKK